MLTIYLSLGLITPSYGSERIRWTPDSERGSVGSTLSGGRRGQAGLRCNVSDEATALDLMVPGDNSKLLTTVANPTLAWHVATAQPVSIAFHFSDPTLANPLYTQTINIEQTTTVSLTLPKNLSLEVNKNYRWTVLVSCPDGNNTEVSARSFIERVNRESLNVDNLSTLEQANTYAQAGIWYDAVASLLTAKNEGVTDAEEMVQTLLEQGQNQAEITLSTVVHL